MQRRLGGGSTGLHSLWPSWLSLFLAHIRFQKHLRALDLTHPKSGFVLAIALDVEQESNESITHRKGLTGVAEGRRSGGVSQQWIPQQDTSCGASSATAALTLFVLN